MPISLPPIGELGFSVICAMIVTEQFRQDARRFEQWPSDEFLPGNPIDIWSGAAGANAISISLGH